MSLMELKKKSLKDPDVQAEYEALDVEFKDIERSLENKSDSDNRV